MTLLIIYQIIFRKKGIFLFHSYFVHFIFFKLALPATPFPLPPNSEKEQPLLTIFYP